MKSTKIRITALFVVIAILISSTAIAAVPDQVAYDAYFSVDRPFFDTQEVVSDAELVIPDTYPFIFGRDDSVAISNISEVVLDTLVPGYMYSKNWKTGEITPFISTEVTGFTAYGEDLLVADMSGAIHRYTSAGDYIEKVVDVPQGTADARGTVSYLVANNDVVFFTANDTLYRYFVPSKVLEDMGGIDESNILYLSALTNNSVIWIEISNEVDPISGEYYTESFVKNLKTGTISIYTEETTAEFHEVESSLSGTASVAASATYFNDRSTSKCTCHGVSRSCNVNGSCDCKVGTWNGQSGIQCLGYAFDWYSARIDKNGSKTAQLSAFAFTGTTANKLAQLSDMLSQSCYGAHIRFNKVNNSSDLNNRHSVIVLNAEYSNDSISITDANRTDTDYCVIKTEEMTYDYIISKYMRVEAVWTQQHSYWNNGGTYICTTCGRTSLNNLVPPLMGGQ